MSLKDYAKIRGVQLLREDLFFIKKSLSNIPQNRHKSILSAYVELWVSIMDNCENVTQAQNLARRAANNWLRKETCYKER